MRHFYEEFVGLEVWRAQPDHVFLRVADGVGGHTQVVVLFEDAETERRQPGSSLHHFAFEIDCEHFDSQRERLEALGLDVSTDVHDWSGWRSLYILDPEGNEVEFVCCDRRPRSG